MKKVSVVLMFMMIGAQLVASVAPYIPSYDDRYQEDLELASANKDYFKEPENELNYAQYRYVGAHSAEKYPRFAPEYVLQEQPMMCLLGMGVRGLQFNVYNFISNWSSMVRDGLSTVCSSPHQQTRVFRKNGKPLYQTLHYEMNRIFNFLKSHPKAVITIWFDDFATIGQLTQDIEEIVRLNQYDPLLKPSDWAAAQQKGEWPTLGWMRSQNKRLVLFTQKHDNHAKYTWPAKHYFWENNYGSTDPRVTCSEEKETLVERNKTKRSLVSFGCYGTVGGDERARNRRLCAYYDEAKGLTESCKKRRFAQGHIFNVYWIDHVVDAINALVKDAKKTIFDYVNELNVLSKK
jgi:hypothetical protein